MGNYSRYPIRKPRTIDRLEIYDCIEIITNDLARYGVPDQVAVSLIMEYFTPLKHAADELKYEYGKMCFENIQRYELILPPLKMDFNRSTKIFIGKVLIIDINS